MALAYSKEFLISAYLSRFNGFISEERIANLKKNAEAHYDKVGKDKFRQHASLDADAIKKYKNGSK